MKLKSLLSISDLRELEDGKFTGGFEPVLFSQLMVFGGTEGDNTNCTGANCVTGCQSVNMVPGCGVPPSK